MNSAAPQHKLTLQPSLMTMEVHVSTNRSWRAPIPFLDFVVDGVPLVEIVLGTGSERLPTRLQTEWELFNLEEQIDRMLGRQEPEYEDGRSAMYICRCGDLDCFAIGARIIGDSEKITWTDWAWKDGFGLTDPIDELDALTFARSEYEHVLGDAARMLATIPNWKPPKQKLLWPWQWEWRLPKEADPMDIGIRAARVAVSRAFLATDPAGLGFGGTWFPDSEYDTEVGRAVSWLANGRSPEHVAARTVRYFKRDWGIDVQTGKQEGLAQALSLIDIGGLINE